MTEALAELISSMEADGYDVAVMVEHEQVRLSVKARPGSCPTCLVPEKMFGDLAYSALLAGGVAVDRGSMRVDYAA